MYVCMYVYMYVYILFEKIVYLLKASKFVNEF